MTIWKITVDGEPNGYATKKAAAERMARTIRGDVKIYPVCRDCFSPYMPCDCGTDN